MLPSKVWEISHKNGNDENRSPGGAPCRAPGSTVGSACRKSVTSWHPRISDRCTIRMLSIIAHEEGEESILQYSGPASDKEGRGLKRSHRGEPPVAKKLCGTRSAQTNKQANMQTNKQTNGRTNNKQTNKWNCQIFKSALNATVLQSAAKIGILWDEHVKNFIQQIPEWQPSSATTQAEKATSRREDTNLMGCLSGGGGWHAMNNVQMAGVLSEMPAGGWYHWASHYKRDSWVAVWDWE